ncbi:MAG TPA: Pycsar system effector family protein [Tepidisphaeraceae bacterium]|jgi:hypothetical protein|nr:Pycsar system effector family protein [Tepidisphaeraceae bacterium]
MKSQTTAGQPEKSILPDQPPIAGDLDPAAALACRTPVQEHALSADGKAAGVLTLLGIMFTILGRFAGDLGMILRTGGWLRVGMFVLVGVFAVLALATVLQAFRTISPRFPKALPSLAFFGDIAKLSREEYIARVEAMAPQEALEQMLRYNHTVSMICVEKFRQLRWAFRLFQWTFLCWLMLVIVLGMKVLH